MKKLSVSNPEYKRRKTLKRWRWRRSAKRSDKKTFETSKGDYVRKKRKSDRISKRQKSKNLLKLKSRRSARDLSKKTPWNVWSSKSATWTLRNCKFSTNTNASKSYALSSAQIKTRSSSAAGSQMRSESRKWCNWHHPRRHRDRKVFHPLRAATRPKSFCEERQLKIRCAERTCNAV